MALFAGVVALGSVADQSAAAPAGGTAHSATAVGRAPKALKLPVVRKTLANGLRVVLSEDHTAPTVAVCVTYDIGARNEQAGRSGFAHLFEHMMFQGSRNVGKGGHFTLISERGGSMNGTTSADRTNYYEVLPSNALELGLWLEADRMKTLAVTAENFENQRKVVQEEFRMRVSNAAYAMGLMRTKELAYKGYWPYEHPTIGSMIDLDNAQLPWIRAFHRSYYAPNNAVLSIAGDFEPSTTLALVDKLFGQAQRAEIPAYSPPQRPAQTEERKDTVLDANARTPGVYMGWVIPPYRSKEHYALELALVMLSYGDSSVLHQRLVREQEQAQSVAGFTYDHRGPDLLVLRAIASASGDPATITRLIDEEIQRLADNGPTPAQLAKAKQLVQSYFLFELETNMPRAIKLANYELFWGDAKLINQEVANFFQVSKEEVQASAAKFLTRSRRTHVLVQPQSDATSAKAASNTQRKGAGQ